MNIKMSFEHTIKEFMKDLPSISGRISNEAALQFELAYCLRKMMGQNSEYTLFFEKNAYQLCNETKGVLRKTEIDISIIQKKITNDIEIDDRMCAIELKFPRNKRYPEEMFMFVEDVKFLEQLICKCKFREAYSIVLVDDLLFTDKSESKRILRKGIYAPFRNHEKFEQEYEPPTKSKSKGTIKLSRSYEITWESLGNNLWYYILAIHKAPIFARCNKEDI